MTLSLSANTERLRLRRYVLGKKANGDGTFDLTLIPYQEGIYITDSGAIPPYEANITTLQKPPPLETVPVYIENINERISDLIIPTLGINKHMYQLMLSVQSKILDSDHDGAIFANQLPFVTQVTLYRGDKEIAIIGEIKHYLGKGGDIFDPMLGSFTPSADDIEFFLINPPIGVTIDENGLVTVSKQAILGTENYIIVGATYLGQRYTTKLYIKCGVYTLRYLGACYTPTGTQTVLVKRGNDEIPVLAWQGDWVSYLGETVENSIWVKGFCMRWNGVSWGQIPIIADGNFESNPYMAAMYDFTNGAPNAAFLSLLVQNLIAKTAMIENLFSKVITLNKNKLIKSENYKEGTSGFLLPANGRAIFNDEIFIYNLKVVSFEIIPPSGTGTLIRQITGNQRVTMTLGVGWYRVELAGAGGGRGGDGRSGLSAGESGGIGGYLNRYFYISHNNSDIILDSGDAGANGGNGDAYVASGAGGDGGGSILSIPIDGLLFVASGGGGGSSSYDSKGGSGGGGCGYAGGSGNANGYSGGNGQGETGGFGGSRFTGGNGGIGKGNGGNPGQAGENGGNNVGGGLGGGASPSVNGFARLYKLGQLRRGAMGI
jgi:hypothetical protein